MPLSMAALLLAAVPAVAQANNVLRGSFGTGQLNYPLGVAVNSSTDGIFVTNFFSGGNDEFSPSGNRLSPPSPFGNTGGNFTGDAVNPTNGQVYVVDAAARAVDTFDPATGAQLGSFPVPGSGNLFGSYTVVQIASDAAGNVYVPNAPNNAVQEYSPSGTLLDTFAGSGATALSAPTGVAVDPSGDVWVADHGNGRIEEFDRTGASVLMTIASPGVQAVALNAAGDVYASVHDGAGRHVIEYDASGTQVDDFGLAQIAANNAYDTPDTIAVDNANGNVYVADATNNVVWIFGLPVAQLTTGAATNVTQTSATLNGTANPNGVAVSDCHFDYGTSTSYGQTAPCVPAAATIGSGTSDVTVSADVSGLQSGVTYHFRLVAADANGTSYGHDVSFDTPGPPSVSGEFADEILSATATALAQVNPHGLDTTYHFEYGTTSAYGQSTAESASIGSDFTNHAASGELTGLQATTTYHYRIVATNSAGSADGPDETLRTLPPVLLEVQPPAGVTASAATLHAYVDPLGVDTRYRFEYGTTTAYGSTTPTTDLGAAKTPQLGSAAISGLQPATTYHFRVVAINAQGTVTGVDDSFTTAAASCPNAAFRTGASAGLPDCRAFEQVSPEDKGGFPAAYPLLGSTGDRVFFNSLGLFAGGTTGDKAYLPYLAQRGADGWSTREVAPPETSTAHGALVGAATADLSAFLTGVVTQPNSQAPESALTWWLTRADGSSQQASPTLQPAGGGQLTSWGGPFGTSSDLSQFVFDAQPLLSSATQTPAFYEAVGATSGSPSVRLVDLDNSGNEIAGCRPLAKSLDSQSQDGSRIVFDDWPQNPGGCSANVWHLYDRIDGSSTVDLSDPLPNDECTTSACQSAQATGARFAAASADGSKVFFFSTQQLTDNASEDSADQVSPSQENCGQVPSARSGCNLYEYDFNRPAGHNLVDLSAGDTGGGGPQVQYFVAASPDGSRVYFAAKGLLTGQPNQLGQTAQAGALNLYVADTTSRAVSFIGLLCPSGGQSSGRPGVSQCPASTGDVASGTGLQITPDLTPDGRYLVFSTYAQLTPDDTNQAADVYEYDAQTGSVVRVSVGHDGQDQNGNGGGQDATVNSNPSPFVQGFATHAVSADGQTVAFLTARPLQTGVVNGQVDAYEWHQGEVTLVSGAQSTNPIQSVAVDPSGQNIVFATDQGLVPQDTDGLADVYDARIGGGFVAPTTTPPCSGDTCQGTPSGAPPPPVAASVSFSGPGNATPSSPGAGRGRVQVFTRTVRGPVFLVAVSVSGPGRITITGNGVKRVARSVTRAGSYRLRVALTRAEARRLRHKRKLRLELRVGFAPAQGHPARANVPVMVKA